MTPLRQDYAHDEPIASPFVLFFGAYAFLCLHYFSLYLMLIWFLVLALRR